MDFEQYLEKDILKFLDSKIQKKDIAKMGREEEYGLYMTRDYLKELNYALDSDELTRAKKLFDELKRTYSKFPKTSYERKKIYNLLEKMYAKIQNYVEIKEGKIEVIKEGESEIHKKIGDKFSTSKYMDRSVDDSVEDLSKLDMDALKETTLPINLGGEKKAEPKKETDIVEDKKTEDVEDKKIATEDEDDKKTAPIEQNIIGKSIIEEPKPTHENKDVDDQEENIFEKPDSSQSKRSIIERLLEDLRSEMEENAIEQNRRIEELRRDIIAQVNIAIEKRMKGERYEPLRNPDIIRGDILKKVYDEAGKIVSSSDNWDSEGPDKMYYKNKTVPASTMLERGLNEHHKTRFSNEDIRIIYEQAIYYMFDNQYDEAAKLFKKIIITQPTNKAARIRLQECIENHPELAEKYSDVNDSILYTSGKAGVRHEKGVIYTGEDFGEGIEDLADAMKKTDTSSAYDPNNEGRHSRHVHEDIDAKEIYDKAISAMFQNNYEDAARMFKQVLNMKPSYKAAKIRLKECLEAMNNA